MNTASENSARPGSACRPWCRRVEPRAIS